MSGSFKASLVVLLAFAGVAALSLWSRPREVIPWRADYAQAADESRRTGKPLLIDFSAEWCGPCQEMRRTTWSDPQVAAALKNLIPVQVDVDRHPDLAARFGVEGIPHLVELDPAGNLVRSGEGYLEPAAFVKWLRSERSASDLPVRLKSDGR